MAETNVDLGAGLLFVVFFSTMWLLVVAGLSFAGGWRDLADTYPAPDDYVPRWHSRFSGARMRGGVSYSSCLKLGADARGLYARPIWCFAPFHPAILIPWPELEYEEERLFWTRMGKFTVKRYPWARFLAGPSATRKLLEARGIVA